MDITAGEARDWTCIIERHAPDGWVAVGDVRFYESTFLHPEYLNRPFNLSTLAFLSGLRMDTLRACNAKNAQYHRPAFSMRKPFLTDDPNAPEDPSVWSKAVIDQATSIFKNPRVFVVGKDYNGIGPNTRHVQRWISEMHICQNLPAILTRAELIKKNAYHKINIIDTFKALQVKTAHEKLASLSKATHLSDKTRIVLIEIQRAPGHL